LVSWDSLDGLVLTAREHAVAEESNEKGDNNKASGVSSFAALLNAEPDKRGYDRRHETTNDCNCITFTTFRLRPYVRQGYSRVRMHTRVHCVRWVHWVHRRESLLRLQCVKVSTVVLVAEVRATALVAKPISNHSARFTRIHLLSTPDELTGYSLMLRFMYRTHR
jgi:hypothetical protein